MTKHNKKSRGNPVFITSTSPPAFKAAHKLKEIIDPLSTCTMRFSFIADCIAIDDELMRYLNERRKELE